MARVDLAYELGLSEMETMALGGWSDAGTMRKIYTHLSNSRRSEGVAQLGAFYASAGESRENGSKTGEKKGVKKGQKNRLAQGFYFRFAGRDKAKNPVISAFFNAWLLGFVVADKDGFEPSTTL